MAVSTGPHSSGRAAASLTYLGESAVPVHVRDLVFVDSAVPDLARLIAGFKPHGELFVLSPDRDALQQIADTLAQGPRGAVALHIVAHGAPGEIAFGNAVLCAATMPQHAALLAQIGALLASDADILLWSCDTARGAQGAAFLDALSEATGAHVAAATHRVGGAAHGGAWELDATTGPVNAAIPFEAEALIAFNG